MYRHAVLLRPLLVGRIIQAAASRWPGRIRGLVGHTMRRVWPRGKHLMIEVSDGTTLRIHLAMHGQWRRLAPGQRLKMSPGEVSLRLDTPDDALVCAHAPTLDRFDTRQALIHPVLSRLGPDVLAPRFDPFAVAAIARHSGHRTAAEALLDQSISCGVGNIYKNELLFLGGHDPFVAPSRLSLAQWAGLYARARTLMGANLELRARDTTRVGAPHPLHWVYGRRGQPCLRCGDSIVTRTHGVDLPRITFWCPRCQTSR